MKKFAEVVSAIAAFALVGAASAADMPTKAPIVKAPMTVPVYNWTGFYVGAQAGWSRFHDSQVLTSPALAPLAVDSSADGFIGGGHAGYNFQMNQFVFGIEADFEGSSAKSTYPIPPPLIQPANGTVRLDWQGSVRGRLGIAADRVLFYGTGGWAFGRFTDGYFTPGTAFNESVSSIRDGWTAGAGIEYAFLNNFTARVEYRYVDWGTHTNNLNVYLSPPGTAADKITENAVRVGVSYKFAP